MVEPKGLGWERQWAQGVRDLGEMVKSAVRRLMLLVVLLPSAAHSWDRHRVLTEAALASEPGLDRMVKAETLQQYLTAIGKGTEKDFLTEQKLNKNTEFRFEAGENAGSTISIRNILIRYADEPDWALDQDLFSQYPELWKDDYLYMGGSQGYQSRAFRHLYFPQGYFRAPEPPSREPVPVDAPLGEAPDRARIFFEQSREAFAQGHPYWGARFLAWALHYLEDMTMPFHTVQLPSLDFVRLKPDGSLDLEATTRLVIYTHLAYDGYPGRALEGEVGPEAERRMRTALGAAAPSAWNGPKELSADAALRAAGLAPKAGAAALAFFPPMTPADAADPLGRVYNPAFWAEVRSRQTADPAGQAAFLEHLEKAIRPAGANIRAFTAAGLHPGAAGMDLEATVDRIFSETEKILKEIGAQNQTRRESSGP